MRAHRSRLHRLLPPGVWWLVLLLACAKWLIAPSAAQRSLGVSPAPLVCRALPSHSADTAVSAIAATGATAQAKEGNDSGTAPHPAHCLQCLTAGPGLPNSLLAWTPDPLPQAAPQVHTARVAPTPELPQPNARAPPAVTHSS